MCPNLKEQQESPHLQNTKASQPGADPITQWDPYCVRVPLEATSNPGVPKERAESWPHSLPSDVILCMKEAPAISPFVLGLPSPSRPADEP